LRVRFSDILELGVRNIPSTIDVESRIILSTEDKELHFYKDKASFVSILSMNFR
jgi:hypothetical protein